MKKSKKTSCRWAAAAGMFAVVLMCSPGCRTAGGTCGMGACPAKPGPKVTPMHAVMGASVEGRPIAVDVYGDGPDVVLLMASIHGNESAGTPLLKRVAEHIATHPQLLRGRTVVFMPVANPDGLAASTRHNVHDIDLNRNFPAGNFKKNDVHGEHPLSEPESRVILAVLDRFHPDRIVSIHQPLKCIDYDGPAAELAEAMGAHTDLPVKKLGSRPGSLGSFAGLTRNIPIITLELPRAADKLSEAQLWKAYGHCILAAVDFPPPTLIIN